MTILPFSRLRINVIDSFYGNSVSKSSSSETTVLKRSKKTANNGKDLFGSKSKEPVCSTPKAKQPQSPSMEKLVTHKLNEFRAEVKKGFDDCIDALGYILDRIEHVESDVKQLQEKPSNDKEVKTPSKVKVPLTVRVSIQL